MCVCVCVCFKSQPSYQVEKKEVIMCSIKEQMKFLRCCNAKVKQVTSVHTDIMRGVSMLNSSCKKKKKNPG